MSTPQRLSSALLPMIGMRAIMLGLVLLVAGPDPARAFFLEDTPERVVFLGFPRGSRDLTVKMVRRKDSYGIYAFRTGTEPGRTLTLGNFAGLVEGSLNGVGLDSRAVTMLRAWQANPANHLAKPERVGPYFRYRFQDADHTVIVTLKAPFVPTEAYPMPRGVISQLYARNETLERMEQLSRAMDVETLQLRDASDLQKIGR